MDSGCLEADESLDDDYDVRRELLPEEVVGIIDQLLCHEVRNTLLRSGMSLTSPLDGMASWLSAITNPLHKRLHRGHPDAHACDHRPGRLWPAWPD